MRDIVVLYAAFYTTAVSDCSIKTLHEANKARGPAFITRCFVGPSPRSRRATASMHCDVVATVLSAACDFHGWSELHVLPLQMAEKSSHTFSRKCKWLFSVAINLYPTSQKVRTSWYCRLSHFLRCHLNNLESNFVFHTVVLALKAHPLSDTLKAAMSIVTKSIFKGICSMLMGI